MAIACNDIISFKGKAYKTFCRLSFIN